MNKVAIKVLGKALTFSSWKGIPYVKVKPKKYPRVRSARVQVMNRRWRICWGLISNMDSTVRDAYKYYTQGTTLTWKDQVVKEIMSIWHETGQTPITIQHFDYTLIDNLLTIHVIFNPIYADEGAGYGLTGWGISPWGSPPGFVTEEGYLPPFSWALGHGDPLPWPWETFPD